MTLWKVTTSLGFLLTTLPLLAHAQDIVPCTNPNNPFCNPPQSVLSVNGFLGLLGRFRDYIAFAFVIITVILFLWAAYLFLTAGDSQERQNKAKRTLLWALIGVVVGLFAYGILTFVRNVLSNT